MIVRVVGDADLQGSKFAAPLVVIADPGGIPPASEGIRWPHDPRGSGIPGRGRDRALGDGQIALSLDAPGALGKKHDRLVVDGSDRLDSVITDADTLRFVVGYKCRNVG